VDTEAERFLEFERWWGGYFRMTGAEIETIVENLFVGNKLASGKMMLGDDGTSTCATSARRWWCLRPGATTSRRRRRR
jgi:hypothetical protein